MFDVTVDGAELVKLLQRFEKKGGDLTPAMAVIAEQLVSAVNDEFESAGHGKWPPHAAATIARNRAGESSQLLKRTGRLAGSIEPWSYPDAAEAATSVSYAVYHVSSAPRKKIPLRDFFDVPDSVIDDACETLLGMLTEAFAALKAK